MPATTITLECPNPSCRHLNPETHQNCEKCSTRLLKRYLWVVGRGITHYQVGELLYDRFLVKSAKVLLDTQPEQPVIVEHENSNLAQPYLRLFAHRPHVPQPYSLLSLERESQEILLLEEAPICQYDLPDTIKSGIRIGAAMPFEMAWARAGALRQLNWLWQLARLWQPLTEQGAALTLLQSRLLRVEGPLVRLLELRPDPEHLDSENTVKLGHLGRAWQQWLPGVHFQLRPFLSSLCEELIQREIETIDLLIEKLDQEISRLGRSQSVQFTVTAQTDQGPTRQRNEDACYLSNSLTFMNLPLTIVCDGMGGHAGGDIASMLAIRMIAEKLQNNGNLTNSDEIKHALGQAIYQANDSINQLNNQENRQTLDRMGTTVVAALAYPPKMYIAHVGDSRAYWITQQGCYQITVDDNMKSRWIETGISFFREASDHRQGVKLVSILGIYPSSNLYPRVREFVMDEDCIFLLCSDGLSDNDCVEKYWETEVLPALTGQIDLSVATRRLIDLANQKNGHDNVTVSLVHCRVLEPLPVNPIPENNNGNHS